MAQDKKKGAHETSLIAEFFSPRILVNCLLFAVIISCFLLWRITYVNNTEILSEEAGETYLWLVLTTFILLRMVSFILYLFARREERAENNRKPNPNL